MDAEIAYSIVDLWKNESEGGILSREGKRLARSGRPASRFQKYVDIHVYIDK